MKLFQALPLTVQDASGKEWQFQFRFWPNNNSRMYVLEGVTPCIQAMQLQAGDTGKYLPAVLNNVNQIVSGREKRLSKT
jgi:hypothetical protein